MAKKSRSEGCEIDMTPMIDVVFQLIIFFIVTIKMDETKNEDIILEKSPHGPIIKKMPEKTMVIEVDKRGRISMSNCPMSMNVFKRILLARYNRYGQFPVLIRGDYRTEHTYVRKVMDACTGVGIWRINFAAIQKGKEPGLFD